MVEVEFPEVCDHIQWFQWQQVVLHNGYVTLVWRYMHWSSQKCLEVMIISTAMSCTKAVCAHCIRADPLECLHSHWLKPIYALENVHYHRAKNTS